MHAEECQKHVEEHKKHVEESIKHLKEGVAQDLEETGERTEKNRMENANVDQSLCNLPQHGANGLRNRLETRNLGFGT